MEDTELRESSQRGSDVRAPFRGQPPYRMIGAAVSMLSSIIVAHHSSGRGLIVRAAFSSLEFRGELFILGSTEGRASAGGGTWPGLIPAGGGDDRGMPS